MRALLIAIAALACSLPAHAQSRTEDWAGVYKFTHHTEISWDGHKIVDAEDILEIVALDSGHAYIRVQIFGRNGDSCRIHGVAKFEAYHFVYRGPMRTFSVNKLVGKARAPTHFETQRVNVRCELTIGRGLDDQGRAAVQLGENDNFCTRGNCGSQAPLRGQTWSLSSRRDIRYLERLRKSPE